MVASSVRLKRKKVALMEKFWRYILLSNWLYHQATVPGQCERCEDSTKFWHHFIPQVTYSWHPDKTQVDEQDIWEKIDVKFGKNIVTVVKI